MIPTTHTPPAQRTDAGADCGTLLIANRGEIAVRIIRTARRLGMRTVVPHAADEPASGPAAGLHLALADDVVSLPGAGTAAYLDGEAVIAAARAAGATHIHPGYGFLAESAGFARAVASAGLTWIGPSPEALALFGDKPATQAQAETAGVPVPARTGVLAAGDADGEAAALLAAHPDGIMLKALAGGGGRGQAVVADPSELASALARCSSEAEAGFGDGRVFAEALITGARHIEVQCLGTAAGVIVLGDRDCSLQQRRQKVVELAPAADLADDVRKRLRTHATALLDSVGYRSLATVEFLVEGDDIRLLEVNARIQVEHTVTEQVTGYDLVELQLREAAGDDLADLRAAAAAGIAQTGAAIELRVAARSAGTITALRWPTGPGVRVDAWTATGTEVSGGFDPLLGKIIVSGSDAAAAQASARAALAETLIDGIETNLGLLTAIGEQIGFGPATTTALDAVVEPDPAEAGSAERTGSPETASAAGGASEADATARARAAEADLADGEELLTAPLTGTVIALSEDPGEYVLLEAMKMHHPVPGPTATAVRHLVAVGDSVRRGDPVAVLTGAGDRADAGAHEAAEHPQLAEVVARHAGVLDDAREAELAKIRARGRRTARENIADLLDEGSFVEYGALAIAAQTKRRSLEDLIARTPADGLIGGLGTIDGQQVVVLSYDYSVLAGTQGKRNHVKTDRLIEIAHAKRIPLILFAEGGGGRPGDVDATPTAGLQSPTFGALARLRGEVPTIAVVSGRCFAGNAALAGVCDLIIATPDANIGMGGPAMIEGGGLGRHRAEDIGPVEVHTANGVIDVLAADEAEAVAVTKASLSILLGADTAAGEPEDPTGRAARTVVPGDRVRAFDMRRAVEAVVDAGSLIEVRREYAPGAITALARVEGKPVIIIANDSRHLGGAIDVDAARSFTQHLRLAGDHGLPVVSFVDTPGFMVGPEAEVEPGVRAFGDLYVVGARLSRSLGAIIVRKGYGLGAMAMAGGGVHDTCFSIAWPSGEVGPMGLEGSVRLGFAKELAAIEDADARAAREAELIAKAYDQGRALSAAQLFDVDDVIDPADTREWIRALTMR